MKRAAWLIFALLFAPLPACSTIGDPGSFPEGFPHGGTGQFRPLERDEVGLNSPLRGRAIAIATAAFDGAMVADGHLFHALAPLRAEAITIPPEHPPNEVYWPAFEPRAIYRSPPRDDLGFAAGTVVFEAAESWEGGEVFDPWVLVEGDVVRLYYAGAGGIGLAVSESIEGPFTRAQATPILAPEAGGVARRPSVVRGPDGALWMYYDAGGSIRAARSEDGVAFADMGAIDPIVAERNRETAESAVDSPEVGIGHPGAVAVDTATGRRLVRVYFSSFREDGTILLFVAGTDDGTTFERHPLPVIDNTDARFPAPVLLDDRVTLLYFNVPFISGSAQVRALVASVSPAAVSFVPEEEP